MRAIAVLGALVVAATGVAVTGTSASAAPKCWTGKWKVTSAQAQIRADGLEFDLRGGKDIKLTLAKNGKATYNFSGSKPLTGKGKVQGVPTQATLTLVKTLRMNNTITGSGKGKVTGKRKSASGDAVLTVKAGLLTQRHSVAKAVRTGGDQGVVPRAAQYTCTAKKLTIRQTVKDGSGYSKTVWQLRRA
ncbi:hypothetical protein LO762_24525 [Actinocorallia sp. API 0066]|uniref:hypothetical protein n=1 Tax=Actinocorallia sp. API 0066 TaxID=2896846 RepID=UPI001E48351C|nr:hypothetical protein [Actinocorallia sp. API 0066]MCD0452333.1 hypothetical protein [Actinocorallia sp. API 0066]